MPPNCQFYVDDASEEWKFDGAASAIEGAADEILDGGKFDYIHGRALAGSFTDPEGWLKFYKEVRYPTCPLGLDSATSATHTGPSLTSIPLEHSHRS